MTVEYMPSFTVAIFSFNGHQDLLPFALSSIQQNVAGYKEIVVVWDDYVRERPVDFDQIRQQSNCDFRLVKHTEIYQWPEEIGQWGWIRQQLAKLLCHTYCDSDYTWICDGDVLVTGDPKLFDSHGTPYLRYHDRAPSPNYNQFIKQYLGLHNFWSGDFVGSTCVFDHAQCQLLDKHIQTTTALDLIESVHHAIIQPNRHNLPFSEFQTYGTWIYNTAPDTHILSERNWNYCNSRARPKGNREELAFDYPIQIMWQHCCPDILDLASKAQWLSSNS